MSIHARAPEICSPPSGRVLLVQASALLEESSTRAERSRRAVELIATRTGGLFGLKTTTRPPDTSELYGCGRRPRWSRS